MAAATVSGCADDGSGGGGGGTGAKATGEGPCDEASECDGDVCVAIIDGDHPPVYCTEECTSGSCPAGFYCDSSTFALVGKTFCRFGTLAPGEPPPTPPKPPRLPCTMDADCDTGQVCATRGGVSDCTLPCTTEPQCTPPPIGGLTIDFFTCAPDDNARSVCLPDPACFANPLSCTSF